MYDALIGKDEIDFSVWKEKDLPKRATEWGKKKKGGSFRILPHKVVYAELYILHAYTNHHEKKKITLIFISLYLSQTVHKKCISYGLTT